MRKFGFYYYFSIWVFVTTSCLHFVAGTNKSTTATSYFSEQYEKKVGIDIDVSQLSDSVYEWTPDLVLKLISLNNKTLCEGKIYGKSKTLNCLIPYKDITHGKNELLLVIYNPATNKTEATLDASFVIEDELLEKYKEEFLIETVKSKLVFLPILIASSAIYLRYTYFSENFKNLPQYLHNYFVGGGGNSKGGGGGHDKRKAGKKSNHVTVTKMTSARAVLSSASTSSVSKPPSSVTAKSNNNINHKRILKYVAIASVGLIGAALGSSAHTPTAAKPKPPKAVSGVPLRTTKVIDKKVVTYERPASSALTITENTSLLRAFNNIVWSKVSGGRK